MDRLVVRRTVAYEQQVIQVMIDLALLLQLIGWSGWKGSKECRRPQGREVAGRGEVAPEAQCQLCNDLAVDLGLSAEPTGAFAGLADIGTP